MNIHYMIIFLISAGAFFLFIFSFTQIILSDKENINYITFAFHFLYGSSVLCDVRYRLG